MAGRYLKRTALLLFYGLVSLLGAAVTLFAFGKNYATNEVSAAALLWAAVGVLAAAVFYAPKRYRGFLRLLLWLGAVFFVWRTFDRTVGGMAYLVNNVIDRINVYYRGGLYYVSCTEKMLLLGDQQMFVSLVCFFGGYAYMGVFLRGKGVFVPILISLCCYFLPATLEEGPGLRLFIGNLIFAGCCLVSGGLIHPKRGKKNVTANVQAMVYVAVSILAVYLLLAVLAPGGRYVQSERLAGLSGKLVFSVEDIKEFSVENWKLSLGVKNEDGISAGSLGDTDRIEYDNNPVFLVTAPKNAGTIYLKAYQAEVYSSKQWKSFEDRVYKRYAQLFEYCASVGFFPQTAADSLELLGRQDTSGIGSSRYSIDVTKYQGDEYSYIPMDMIIADGSPAFSKNEDNSRIKAEYDRHTAFAYSDKGKENITHTFTAAAWQNVTDLETLIIAGEAMAGVSDYYYDGEEAYRGFVYENYLDVNTPCAYRIRDELLPAIKGGDYSTDSGSGKARFIQDTVEYFRQNYSYTLNPGAVPSGEDFVEYFLFQSKEGFCTYFATAAVMVFRSGGIPARYAEGYVIPQSLYGKTVSEVRAVDVTMDGTSWKENWDYYEVEVTDRYAHAWAEIYLDGVGWVIIDPTPGYASYPGMAAAGNETDPEEESSVPWENETESQGEGETETEGGEDTRPSSETEDDTKEEEKESFGGSKKPEDGSGFGGSGEGSGEEKSSSVDMKAFREKAVSLLKAVGRVLLTVVKIVTAPALIVLFFIFRQKYVEEKRNRLYNEACGMSRRQRVEQILRYLDKLLKYEGAGVGRAESYGEYYSRHEADWREAERAQRFFSLVEKSLYSEAGIEEEEVMLIMAFIADKRQEMYRTMNRCRKIYFKYILAY